MIYLILRRKYYNSKKDVTNNKIIGLYYSGKRKKTEAPRNGRSYSTI